MTKTNPSSSSRTSNFDREQYLYLTTRGRRSGLPRQIEIWFTYREERFYLIAEYATSKWLQNLRAHPAAQMRVGENNSAVRARFVSAEAEPELHHAVADLSHEKYGWGEGTVVELIPETKAASSS